jgi:SARP family transcriptional regulator, regulator of embCAB operon
MVSDPGIRCNRDRGFRPGRPVRSVPVSLGLVILRGGPSGARFHLHEDAIIGRIDLGIMLDDDEVSRYHAIVRVNDGGADITDLGSTNGTFVDGHRLTGRVPLVDGSVIRVGQTELRVVGGG